jgi:hypothetical protein
VPPADTPKPKPAPAILPMSLEDVIAPTTGKRGQPVELTVTGVDRDGCYGEEKVVAQVDETQRIVTFQATNAYLPRDGYACTQSYVFKAIPTTFVPMSTGAYRIQAKVGIYEFTKRDLVLTVNVTD